MLEYGPLHQTAQPPRLDGVQLHADAFAKPRGAGVAQLGRARDLSCNGVGRVLPHVQPIECYAVLPDCEMHIAFREGGAEAIRKVMKNQPAIFLKLLVLLVPRELQIEHRGGVKGMTEEQIVDAIEARRLARAET